MLMSSARAAKPHKKGILDLLRLFQTSFTPASGRGSDPPDWPVSQAANRPQVRRWQEEWRPPPGSENRAPERHKAAIQYNGQEEERSPLRLRRQQRPSS